jgi:multidrug resistance efflux pump
MVHQASIYRYVRQNVTPVAPQVSGNFVNLAHDGLG